MRISNWKNWAINIFKPSEKLQQTKPPKEIWHNPFYFIAFGFGSGAIPFAPGTMGTLLAIPIYLLLRELSPFIYLLFLVAAILFGIIVCDTIEKKMGVHDYSAMNWDEFVGFWVAMFMMPHHWIWIVIGFCLFRLFDIWKPWPISWLDRSVYGGVGVMVDDIAAGILAWIVLRILIMFYS